jgi:hypothetical protein
MKNVQRILKVAFAANAMAFLGMLIAFLIVLFLQGQDAAGRVWTAPYYYLICWPLSVFICIKFLKS